MTPVNPGPDVGEFRAEDAARGCAVLVIAGIVLGVVFSGNCKRDQPNTARDQQPDPWARDPWGRDPKIVAEERRLQEEARRKLSEDTDRLVRQLDEKERQVRAFTAEEKYRDAVTLANSLGRDHASEANRLGYNSRLQMVQREAIRTAGNLAKTRAVRLIGRDQYADAVRVIEELVADVGPCANECGMTKELEDLRQAYLFARDLAKAAETGGTK